MVKIQQKRVDAHVHSIDIDRELQEALERKSEEMWLDDTKNRVWKIIK